MRVRREWLVSFVIVLALLWSPPVCLAAIRGRIVENVGIKTAKLGLHDTTNKARIGPTYARVTDKSYAGLTVYKYRFKTLNASTRKYPVLMYSKSNHHVFNFTINCTTLVTARGAHVGTTEAALAGSYGTRLKKSVGPVYTDYWMGTRSGRTDFFVKSGKVYQIVISRY